MESRRHDFHSHGTKKVMVVYDLSSKFAMWCRPLAQRPKSADDAGIKTSGAKTATAEEEEKQPQRKTATAVKCKKGKSRREGKNKKKVIQ